MPRSLWNGTISVGLINVPIKLYSAVESKTVHFREVHLADEAKVEHRRFCSAEDREVPYEEVVKGFEVKEDQYVILDKDEIAAAAGDRGHVIEVERFVETGAIDPVGSELDFDEPGRGPSKREVQMAGKLVSSLHEDFDPGKRKDEYRETVLDMIKRLAAGKKPRPPKDKPPEEAPDLMAALKASLS
jgi:non-homologous end joining protein Ku